MTNDTCVSATVFAFVLVLVLIFAFTGGAAGIWWLGSRKTRKLHLEAEKMQREKDALRDKELQVHATATQHYLSEIQHWRKSFEKLQEEAESYKKALESNGIAFHRQSMAGNALIGSRPGSLDIKMPNRDLPSIPNKLNFAEKDD